MICDAESEEKDNTESKEVNDIKRKEQGEEENRRDKEEKMKEQIKERSEEGSNEDGEDNDDNEDSQVSFQCYNEGDDDCDDANENKSDDIQEKSNESPSLNTTPHSPTSFTSKLQSTPKTHRSKTTLTPNISPVVCNSKKSELQTKEAKMLQAVLGSDVRVQQLDQVKLLFKAQPSKPRHNNYLDVLAQIQTLTLQKETHLKSKLKIWETNFAMTHDLATPSDSDRQNNSNTQNWTKRLKIIITLKKMWDLKL